MKNKLFALFFLLLINFALFTGKAYAVVINDLTSDWTDGGLPIAGVWDLREGASSLNAVPHIVGVDTFPGVQPAYQGNNFPVWFKSTFDGSAFSNPANIDWQVGDVIMHTDNGGANSAAVWTSTFDGTIDINGSLWNPRNFNRSQNYSVTVNGGPAILSGTVTDLTDRNNREIFGAVGINVNVGDEIALNLIRNTTDDYLGVTFTISSDLIVDVTEPSTILLLLGLIAIVLLRRSTPVL